MGTGSSTTCATVGNPTIKMDVEPLAPEKRPFLGYENLANSITMLGLFFALASCYFAGYRNLRLSIICLIVSGICDMSDGAVARMINRTTEEKKFGIQLDTIADVISFGVTPVIIMFSLGARAWYVLIVYAFYVTCAVIRLAHFNTSAVPDVHKPYYRGLPVTNVAWILPAITLFGSVPAGVVTLAVLGFFFVLNIKVPKLRITVILGPVLMISLLLLWWLR